MWLDTGCPIAKIDEIHVIIPIKFAVRDWALRVEQTEKFVPVSI